MVASAPVCQFALPHIAASGLPMASRIHHPGQPLLSCSLPYHSVFHLYSPLIFFQRFYYNVVTCMHLTYKNSTTDMRQ